MFKKSDIYAKFSIFAFEKCIKIQHEIKGQKN